MVGQVHLRGREPADPAQGLPAEDGRELLLPGAKVQHEVRGGRGRGDRVAPHRAQPLRVPPQVRVAGDPAEPVEHVAAAHLPQPVEQLARVVEHDARGPPRADELSDQVADPGVALGEDRGVVAVADARVPHHVVEVADDLRGPEVGAAGRDQGLMHVQGDRERRAEAVESQVGLVEVHRVAGAGDLLHLGLRPAEVREAVDHLGNGSKLHAILILSRAGVREPFRANGEWPMTEHECRRTNKMGQGESPGPH